MFARQAPGGKISRSADFQFGSGRFLTWSAIFSGYAPVGLERTQNEKRSKRVLRKIISSLTPPPPVALADCALKFAYSNFPVKDAHFKGVTSRVKEGAE